MIAVLITPTNIVVSDTLDVMIHQCSLLSNTETHDTDLVDKSSSIQKIWSERKPKYIDMQ